MSLTLNTKTRQSSISFPLPFYHYLLIRTSSMSVSIPSGMSKTGSHMIRPLFNSSNALNLRHYICLTFYIDSSTHTTSPHNLRSTNTIPLLTQQRTLLINLLNLPLLRNLLRLLQRRPKRTSNNNRPPN